VFHVYGSTELCGLLKPHGRGLCYTKRCMQTVFIETVDIENTNDGKLSIFILVERSIYFRVKYSFLTHYLCISGFQIEGPSQTKIECHDNGDGSANISYVPFAPGEYAVHVTCDDEDIQGSPWMATVVAGAADFDPTKVGDGLYMIPLLPSLLKTTAFPLNPSEKSLSC